MPELDDHQLLAQFAADKSETAFAALVDRHIHLVYSVALRATGSPHAAQEVSQAVFIILAGKAARISGKTILSGWLYQTTRLTAANFLRGEIRRQKREQEAYMQSTLNEPASDAWPQIAPLLDDALSRLGERDRNAIVLRYYQNKSLREVGHALGAGEDAAKMRVSRALEKLRKIFTGRGVLLSTAVIAAAVSAHSVQAAPAGLAKSISAAALAKGAVAGGSTLTLMKLKGAIKLMAWSKMKTTLVVGAALLTTVTTTVIVTHTPAARASALARANITRANNGVATDPQAVAEAVANSKILIFRNIRSWDRHPDFEEVLADLKFKFDVKPASAMGTTDLAHYDLIIIPGAQWKTGYYATYNDKAALFDDYVSNGGTLLFELNGAENERLTLPGGVRMLPHGAVDNLLSTPEHPILLPLGGKPIHANYASHGYLSGVPKGATVLATEMDKNKLPIDRPTFVEYTFGSGRVIAACQCFHDRDGSGRGPLMKSAVDYAAVRKWFAPR